MKQSLDFLKQIEDLIAANGWTDLFYLKILSESPTIVRVNLSEHHRTHPEELVNEYTDGVHPLEQVQQELLRALRTGRTGI